MPNDGSKKSSSSLYSGWFDDIINKINKNESYKLQLQKSDGYIQYK